MERIAALLAHLGIYSEVGVLGRKTLTNRLKVLGELHPRFDFISSDI
jgi:hypothetical protein